MVETSLTAVLRERASLQPDDTAFTFVDYEQDWDGVAESVTWPQLYRQVCTIAEQLKLSLSPGDRAVILAPQGLDYVLAFLGALHAGVIAVPLSVPLGGVSDERVDSVIRDASPTAVLTTSSVVKSVASYFETEGGEFSAPLIEIDLLKQETPSRSAGDDPIEGAIAYLQYTSGSTRNPAGVMITHENLQTNYEQLIAGYFADRDGIPPFDSTLVSWLPLYHDMGLVLGVCAPILGGYSSVLMSPVAFLQRPARWMHLLASYSSAFSAAPNFAFELAARKTSDEDMAGFDLGNVHTILSGSERVHPATLTRFTDRFARFGLDKAVLRPSYGLAEATVYVATSRAGAPPTVVDFESDKLAAGQAKRCAPGDGTALISYPLNDSPLVCIVDPDTGTECPPATTGEIWVHGDNVAAGYWNKPDDTARVFGATLTNPSPATPAGPWLRTGDLGFVTDGELFIVGRIKDLLIVYGRNHSPDDIEATTQEISKGRVAAIAVPRDTDGVEELVVIIETKPRGDTDEAIATHYQTLKRDVTSAISNTHGLAAADIVVVPPGALPITTSGKVRRNTCIDLYRTNQLPRQDT